MNRVEQLEYALQNTLNFLVPLNPKGEVVVKEAKDALAARAPRPNRWVDRDELLAALARVDSPTSKALLKELNRVERK